MTALTVGYVSGIIALAMYVVQGIYPNLVGLILIGTLNKERTAVTWSVVSRELQTTSWPTLLGSDTSASAHVNRWVKFVGRMRLFLTLLVAVTAIVTPLGLHSTIERANRKTPVMFEYVADSGAMGKATMPPPKEGFSRICSHAAVLPEACPGDDMDVNFTHKDHTVTAHFNGSFDVRIPHDRAAFFQSGLDDLPSTVSSFFDIHYRRTTYQTQPHANHDKPYPVGSYIPITNFAMDNTTEAVEGLIVDTLKGRVGFRNHTGPRKVEIGASWSEDLLFIEPFTTCVDTNLTLEFQITPSSAINDFRLGDEGVSNVSIIDNGGFVNLNTTYPEHYYYHTQQDPEMQFRAYKLAWFYNALTMTLLNVSEPGFPHIRSKLGQKFPLKRDVYMPPPNAIVTTNSPGYWLNIKGPNKFYITLDNYTEPILLCSGQGGNDVANMTSIGVSCGMMFGGATPRDSEASPYVYTPGSWWTRPLYSCASATQASIKTVHFHWNALGATPIKRLEVLDIVDKEYKKKSDMPLWAVEDGHDLNKNIIPIWGLASKKYANLKSSNYSLLQAPRLILPGYNKAGLNDGPFNDFSYSQSYENLPAALAPRQALSSLYDISDSSRYSGFGNLAMLSRWRELTESAQTTSQVLDLIWTDFAANAMTGSRSQLATPRLPPNLQKRSELSKSAREHHPHTMVPVHIFQEKITFRMVFAIPAFLTLGCILFLFAVTGYYLARGQSGPKHMAWYLDRLSAGRLLALVSSHETETTAFSRTKDWIKNVGKAPISLEIVDGADLPPSRARREPALTGLLKQPATPAAESDDETYDLSQVRREKAFGE